MDAFTDNDLQTMISSEFPAFNKVPSMNDYQSMTKDGTHICFDFNYGARVFIPKESKNVRVQIRDTDTGILHVNQLCNNIEGEEQDLYISTKIKYFVNWDIYIFDVVTAKVVMHHVFNIDKDNRDIAIEMPFKGALGDTIAWFAMVAQFAKLHDKTRINLLMNESCHNLFDWSKYPNIYIKNKDYFELRHIQKGLYATYRISMYYGNEKEDDVYNNPVDYRISGLAKIASNILGMYDVDLVKPAIAPRLEEARRTKGHKYVVIATKTTCHVKHWLNPLGWNTVVEYLQSLGYLVYCIDRDDCVFGHEKGNESHFSAFYTPSKALDYTGKISLSSRLNFIKHAELFIGLSSGLSWLAWLTETPVVMISNFTAAHNEFYTPYRVMNRTVCNSCWNDSRHKFINSDWFYCPRHRNDTHAHECQRMISSQMVIDMINKALMKKVLQ